MQNDSQSKPQAILINNVILQKLQQNISQIISEKLQQKTSKQEKSEQLKKQKFDIQLKKRKIINNWSFQQPYILFKKQGNIKIIKSQIYSRKYQVQASNKKSIINLAILNISFNQLKQVLAFPIQTKINKQDFISFLVNGLNQSIQKWKIQICKIKNSTLEQIQGQIHKVTQIKMNPNMEIYGQFGYDITVTQDYLFYVYRNKYQQKQSQIMKQTNQKLTQTHKQFSILKLILQLRNKLSNFKHQQIIQFIKNAQIHCKGIASTLQKLLQAYGQQLAQNLSEETDQNYNKEQQLLATILSMEKNNEIMIENNNQFVQKLWKKQINNNYFINVIESGNKINFQSLKMNDKFWQFFDFINEFVNYHQSFIKRFANSLDHQIQQNQNNNDKNTNEFNKIKGMMIYTLAQFIKENKLSQQQIINKLQNLLSYFIGISDQYHIKYIQNLILQKSKQINKRLYIVRIFEFYLCKKIMRISFDCKFNNQYINKLQNLNINKNQNQLQEQKKLCIRIMKSIRKYVYNKDDKNLNIKDYQEYKNYVNKKILPLPKTKQEQYKLIIKFQRKQNCLQRNYWNILLILEWIFTKNLLTIKKNELNQNIAAFIEQVKVTNNNFKLILLKFYLYHNFYIYLSCPQKQISCKQQITKIISTIPSLYSFQSIIWYVACTVFKKRQKAKQILMNYLQILNYNKDKQVCYSIDVSICLQTSIKIQKSEGLSEEERQKEHKYQIFMYNLLIKSINKYLANIDSLTYKQSQAQDKIQQIEKLKSINQITFCFARNDIKQIQQLQNQICKSILNPLFQKTKLWKEKQLLSLSSVERISKQLIQQLNIQFSFLHMSKAIMENNKKQCIPILTDLFTRYEVRILCCFYQLKLKYSESMNQRTEIQRLIINNIYKLTKRQDNQSKFHTLKLLIQNYVIFNEVVRNLLNQDKFLAFNLVVSMSQSIYQISIKNSKCQITELMKENIFRIFSIIFAIQKQMLSQKIPKQIPQKIISLFSQKDKDGKNSQMGKLKAALTKNPFLSYFVFEIQAWPDLFPKLTPKQQQQMRITLLHFVIINNFKIHIMQFYEEEFINCCIKCAQYYANKLNNPKKYITIWKSVQRITKIKQNQIIAKYKYKVNQWLQKIKLISEKVENLRQSIKTAKDKVQVKNIEDQINQNNKILHKYKIHKRVFNKIYNKIQSKQQNINPQIKNNNKVE